MARTYEDLSRRALIKLNHDFDEENNGKLQKYLEKRDEENPYEGIRTIETITVKVDDIVDTVRTNKSALKQAAINATETALNKTIDAITNAINYGKDKA